MRSVATSIKFRLHSRIHSKRPLVLVYTKGKTGSSTIFSSLHKKGVKRVFQLHTLDHDTIVNRLDKHRESSENFPTSIINSRVLKKEVNKLVERGDRVNIITLIREPLSNYLSSFFQNKKKLEGTFNDDADLLAVLKEQFNTESDWFDRELRGKFDLDVFEYSFPTDLGYLTIDKGNIKVLLLRTDKIDESGAQALQMLFPELKKIDIVGDNISKEKDYFDSYEHVKKNFRLSRDELREIYKSKLSTHFFSKIELDSFISKWSI